MSIIRTIVSKALQKGIRGVPGKVIAQGALAQIIEVEGINLAIAKNTEDFISKSGMTALQGLPTGLANLSSEVAKIAKGAIPIPFIDEVIVDAGLTGITAALVGVNLGLRTGSQIGQNIATGIRKDIEKIKSRQHSSDNSSGRKENPKTGQSNPTIPRTQKRTPEEFTTGR